MRISILAAASILLSIASAQLIVSEGKIVLLDSVGISQIAQDFTSTAPSPLPLTPIDPTNVLKINFIVTEDGNDEGIQPSQTMILWEPVNEVEKKERGRDHLSVVKVRRGGKGKFELDFSRASTSLLAVSTGPITATLLIGHSKHPALRIPLGTFQLSSDLALSFPYPADDTLPAAWEVERYKKMPEITWTFKEKEKDVKTPVAVLGLLFVLAPWVVILGVASHLKPSLASPTFNILSFLLCIFSFESLIVAYWTSLKLIPTLPYFGLLAILTAYTGRKALSDLRSRRLIREASKKKDL